MSKQTVLLAAAALAASASAIRGLIDTSQQHAIPFTHEKLAEHVADFADDAAAFVDALSHFLPEDEHEDAPADGAAAVEGADHPAL